MAQRHRLERRKLERHELERHELERHKLERHKLERQKLEWDMHSGKTCARNILGRIGHTIERSKLP